MSKTRLFVTLGVLLLLVLTTAVPALAGTATVTYSAVLKGANEAPAVDTDAYGKVTFLVSEDGESMRFLLGAVSIDNPVAAHIHIGAPGENGPVVVGLFSGTAGGGEHNGLLSKGKITADNLTGPLAGQPFSALLDLIASGNAYVNVHTNDGVAPTNTGAGDMASGEIRGQLH